MLLELENFQHGILNELCHGNFAVFISFSLSLEPNALGSLSKHDVDESENDI